MSTYSLPVKSESVYVVNRDCCLPACPFRVLYMTRLPFEARSLNELKNKIIMGTFAPLKPGAPYSAALVAVCHALLNKDPRKRPTCAAVLNSSEAAPWLYTIPEPVRCPLPALDALPSECVVRPAKQRKQECCWTGDLVLHDWNTCPMDSAERRYSERGVAVVPRPPATGVVWRRGSSGGAAGKPPS